MVWVREASGILGFAWPVLDLAATPRHSFPFFRVRSRAAEELGAPERGMSQASSGRLGGAEKAPGLEEGRGGHRELKGLQTPLGSPAAGLASLMVIGTRLRGQLRFAHLKKTWPPARSIYPECPVSVVTWSNPHVLIYASE